MRRLVSLAAIRLRRQKRRISLKKYSVNRSVFNYVVLLASEGKDAVESKVKS